MVAGCSTATGATSAAPAGTVAAAADVAACDPSTATIKLNFGPQSAPAVELAVAQMEQKYPGLTFDATPSATSSYNDLTKQVIADTAVGKPADLINTGLGQLTFWVDSYSPGRNRRGRATRGVQPQLPDCRHRGRQGLSRAVPDLHTGAHRQPDPAPSRPASTRTTPITSYDELIADAEILTAQSGQPSVNLSTDGLPDWFSQGLVQTAGGTFVNADGTAGFGDATGLAALELWPALAKDNLLLNIGLTDALAQFTAGTLPFYFATTSLVATLQKGIETKFDWMPVDVPTLDGTDAGPLPAGGNGWLVLSQDSCKAAYANEMIGLMLSKEISLAASGAGYSYIPVNTQAATELLAGPNATPQLTYAWSYDKPLSVWGGFPGTATAPDLHRAHHDDPAACHRRRHRLDGVLGGRRDQRSCREVIKMPTVELHAVSKHFGKVTALDGINLSIADGEQVVDPRPVRLGQVHPAAGGRGTGGTGRRHPDC